jgi:hypothetical protein
MSKLEIPDELKYLKGLRYEPAMKIDYQNVQLEDVLPGLFYLIRLGRRRGKGGWSGRTANQAAVELAECAEKFKGFADEKGKAVLEEWLKASVLRINERRGSDKVMSIRPLHFMTYRVDLPTNWVHLRSVPEFLAAILQHDPSAAPLKTVDDGRREAFALQSPNNLFWKAFGAGMANKDGQTSAENDIYEETTELDIESLLAVRTVEGLRPPQEVTVGGAGVISGFEPLCPQQARIFRDDFSLFLRAYSSTNVPLRTLGDYILCLMALHLPVYSLCHMAASNHLYETGEWVSDKHAEGGKRVWELGIYPDLTGGRDRKSRELAQQSYATHYGMMMQQLRAMIGFRLLEHYLRGASDIRELRQIRSIKGIELLRTLARGRQPSSTDIYFAAQGSARPALSTLEGAQPDGKWPEELMSIVDDTSLPPFDKLVEILATTQDELRAQMTKFITSHTRRNLESGLLAGSPRKPDDNYYTLSIQLLETLVQLLILKPCDPPSSRPLDIYDFVKLLKERYSIWIDEPPPHLDQSHEARKAAQTNFDALKEKLRQLGFFRAVTDARRMQRLRPRYIPTGDLSHT